MSVSNANATCLVTGVAGFVGSSLAEELISRGHAVIGIDCFTDYYARALKEENLARLRLSERFRFLEADLLEIDLSGVLSGDQISAERVDYVFHLAAQAGVRASWGRSFEIYTRNNILATQRLLEAAREVPPTKFVYASSSSIYGDAETYPTAEDLTPHPISPYGVSKLAGEHLCALYFRNYGVRTNSLRYFTVYGPRQRPDMAFNRFIKSIAEGGEIEIYGDGEQTRDFTFVEDAVAGTIAAAMAEVSGEVFNIGGGSRVTVNEVLRRLESILEKRAKVKYIAEQKGDVRHTSADTSKAKALLGYRPSVSLHEGLSREAEWLQKTIVPVAAA